jgi:hypothetical protein
MADSSFTTYESVLSHYPFLSGRSLGPQEMGDMPNLKRLKMQAAARRMTDNSLENARICQFEVPGGGECRDTACADVHLGQLEVEPKGTPRPVTLSLFCHVTILSAPRGWVWGMVDCLQMRRPHNICPGIRMWRKWFKRFKRRVLGGQMRPLMSA